MNYLFFAAGAEEAASGLPLGINPGAFLIQLVTFVIIFLLLKKFAFVPINNMLEKRRKTIDDAVRLGRELEKERDNLDEKIETITRDARLESDKIIAAAHKDARDVISEAEKNAQRKVDLMLADAETRIHEESEQARRNLEDELVTLVSEATETIVSEKVDAKKDAELVKKAMQRQKNS